MKRAQSLQFMHQVPKAIYTNGLFACGVLNDYRADWALVTNFEQLETEIDTIQRNPG